MCAAGWDDAFCHFSHVVADKRQIRSFWKSHPLHHLFTLAVSSSFHDERINERHQSSELKPGCCQCVVAVWPSGAGRWSWWRTSFPVSVRSFCRVWSESAALWSWCDEIGWANCVSMLLQTPSVRPQQLTSHVWCFIFSETLEPSPPTSAQIRYGERSNLTHTHTRTHTNPLCFGNKLQCEICQTFVLKYSEVNSYLFMVEVTEQTVMSFVEFSSPSFHQITVYSVSLNIKN